MHMSVPQLMILLDHLLLGILFLIALFCVVAAASANMVLTDEMMAKIRKNVNSWHRGTQVNLGVQPMQGEHVV